MSIRFYLLFGSMSQTLSRFVFVFILAAMLPLQSASAQEVHIDAGFQEAYAVQGVLLDLFDGMYQGDSTAVRRVFHRDARLFTAPSRDEDETLRETPVNEFLETIAEPRDETWDEHIWDVEVQVDGSLASAWMQYAFYIGDALNHCGVNAVQFVREEDRWEITQLTDTRRTENCDVPDFVEEERERRNSTFD